MLCQLGVYIPFRELIIIMTIINPAGCSRRRVRQVPMTGSFILTTETICRILTLKYRWLLLNIPIAASWYCFLSMSCWNWRRLLIKNEDINCHGNKHRGISVNLTVVLSPCVMTCLEISKILEQRSAFDVWRKNSSSGVKLLLNIANI